ncbi:hypothetical protein DSM110093_03739 (plasmid) [Sulfitobacter sp. DSM 110093]|uniref:DUF995 domain-containing protein n=1 Tax=Sulfitobacter sp. DSM 110093 TaxID=2883127 RepID=UPI001FAC047C|nr:DUF995 domain-containing protein [Sulfitobacter sp. DSM 110093]UOA33904.1 hypothetical protein DSM110093_03739 [Sulfitobacter sp. DSM 110093]
MVGILIDLMDKPTDHGFQSFFLSKGSLTMVFPKSWLMGLLIAALPLGALADPLPYGAKTPTASQVRSAYIGKTEKWDADCSGGIYFGANNQARAWCAQSGDSLGAGEWTVDAYGRMCHNLTWYWPNNGRAGSSPGEKSCVLHVADRFDRIWRSYPGQSEWWPVKGDASLSSGYVFQNQVVALKRKLGI